jgi:hypothetical protein
VQHLWVGYFVAASTHFNVKQILEQLAFYKKAHKNDRAYQFWQEGVHPELIQNDEAISPRGFSSHIPVPQNSGKRSLGTQVFVTCLLIS